MTRLSLRANARTFCVDPGALHWLPGSYLALRLFPKTLEIFAANSARLRFLAKLTLDPIPVGNFAIFTDWLRGEIDMRLQAEHQLQVWRFRATEATGWSCQLTLARTCDACRVALEGAENTWNLSAKESLVLSWDALGESVAVAHQKTCPRALKPRLRAQISFGCHKSADWSRIHKRANLQEVGPLLHMAGQWAQDLLPPLPSAESGPPLTSLAASRLGSLDRDLAPGFSAAWRAHFGQCAFPRWEDEDHRGLPSVWQSARSPLYLYALFSKWLTQKLWRESESLLQLLPALPALLPAGRVLLAACSLGRIDLHWSKKELQRVVLHCSQSGRYQFAFPKYAQQVRAKRSDRRFGVTFPLNRGNRLTLALEGGKKYLLDRLRA